MSPQAVARLLLKDLAAGDDDIGVIVRQNYAELREHSVKAVRAGEAAAPEVEAVADAGVRLVNALCGVVGLGLSRLARPEFGDDLLAAVLSAVAHAVGDLGELLRGYEQSPAAGLKTVGVCLPGGILADAEGLEEARREIFAHGEPGQLLNYGSHDIAVFADILPVLARGKRPARAEKALEP